MQTLKLELEPSVKHATPSHIMQLLLAQRTRPRHLAPASLKHALLVGTHVALYLTSAVSRTGQFLLKGHVSSWSPRLLAWHDDVGHLPMAVTTPLLETSCTQQLPMQSEHDVTPVKRQPVLV